jgi:Protein of unknown function (DUF2510)
MSAGGTPPGWYPDVERPGGERYWDGSAWTENRRAGGGDPTVQGFGGTQDAAGQSQFGRPQFGQPQFGQQPGEQPPHGGPPYGAPQYGAPQYGAPSGYQPYGAFGTASSRSSKSGLALGLSITSIFVSFCCGIGIFLAIPGAVIGWQEMKAIDRGELDPSTRGAAKGAFIIGVIVLGVVIAFFLLWMVLVVVGSA